MKKTTLNNADNEKFKNFSVAKPLEERKPYWELIDKKAESNNTIDLNAYTNGVLEAIVWQQERSYSEEDMKSFADWCRNGLLNTEYSVDRLDQHLEKWSNFKKK